MRLLAPSLTVPGLVVFSAGNVRRAKFTGLSIGHHDIKGIRISDDGSVVVGTIECHAFPYAFRWTEEEGVVFLTDVLESGAGGVSAVGSLAGGANSVTSI